MKQQFGGLLAIALGTVLLVNGLTPTSEGTVGIAAGRCGGVTVGALPSQLCPTGSIVITDTTSPPAGAPTSWDVTITSSNCTSPHTSGLPVNVVVTVPTGGSNTSSDLFVYTDENAAVNSTKCEYTLTRNVDPTYTVTFTPPSPVTLPFSNDPGAANNGVLQVAMANRAVTPTTGAAPSTSPAPSSAAPKPSTSVSSSSAATASASNSAALATTGPSQPVKASLWLGIALLLLGLFLCFTGRVRRIARHED